MVSQDDGSLALALRLCGSACCMAHAPSQAALTGWHTAAAEEHDRGRQLDEDGQGCTVDGMPGRAAREVFCITLRFAPSVAPGRARQGGAPAFIGPAKRRGILGVTVRARAHSAPF
jgi:hypothetical protein